MWQFLNYQFFLLLLIYLLKENAFFFKYYKHKNNASKHPIRLNSSINKSYKSLFLKLLQNFFL